MVALERDKDLAENETRVVGLIGEAPGYRFVIEQIPSLLRVVLGFLAGRVF